MLGVYTERSTPRYRQSRSILECFFYQCIEGCSKKNWVWAPRNYIGIIQEIIQEISEIIQEIIQEIIL